MKNVKALYLLCFILSSCGKSDDEEILANFDIQLIPIDPIPGEYPFRPIVRLKKIDDGTGLGRIKVKNDKARDFVAAVGCEEIFGEVDSAYNCVAPGKEMLQYFYESPKTKSDVASVVYNLKQNKKNFDIISQDAKAKKREKLSVDEVKTYCRYNKADNTLWVHIQGATPSLPGKWAYTIFPLGQVNEGDTVRFDSTTAAVAGIQLQEAGKLDPTEYTPPRTYRTKAVAGTELVDDIKDDTSEGAHCEVRVDKLRPGEVTRGAIDCLNLPLTERAEDADKKILTLGDSLDLSADWQCDFYN